MVRDGLLFFYLVSKTMERNPEEILKEIQSLKEEMRKKAGSHLVTKAQELFSEFPSLQGFAWKQFTPYFNDGAACIFGVSGFVYLFKLSTGDVIELNCDFFDYGYTGLDDLEKVELADIRREEWTELTTKQEKLDTFYTLLIQSEEYLKDWFGDPSEVILTRDLDVLQVKEYLDHD